MQKHISTTASVQLIEISAEQAQQRIDNFLIGHLKGVPKSRIYRMLRTGEVRVNRGRIKAQYRLHCGDTVRIPPVTVAAATVPVVPLGRFEELVKHRILYEDEELLVVNKPAGIAVHGGSGLSYGLIEGLRQLRPQAKFLELVHRLDRDTSGCLVIAKRRQALTALHALFRDDAISKTYIALLDGCWQRKRQVVEAALQKNTLQGGERMVRVSATGKPASTQFRRLRKFSQATLVEAQPKTGRTHQIRVHAAHLGYPIVGDTRYGDETHNDAFRKKGLKRLFLHAQVLEFRHPRTTEKVRIEAALDSDLEKFLRLLE